MKIYFSEKWKHTFLQKWITSIHTSIPSPYFLTKNLEKKGEIENNFLKKFLCPCLSVDIFSLHLGVFDIDFFFNIVIIQKAQTIKSSFHRKFWEILKFHKWCVCACMLQITSHFNFQDSIKILYICVSIYPVLNLFSIFTLNMFIFSFFQKSMFSFLKKVCFHYNI